MYFNCQPLLEDLHRFRLFYEIYPELPGETEDTQVQWFEIALHLEVAEHRPNDHPENRMASLLLIGLADHLVQRVRSHARFALDMPASYNTLHPPAPKDQNQPRMALTLSLVFSDVGPYPPRETPGLLTQLRAELALLGIPRGMSLFGCAQCH